MSLNSRYTILRKIADGGTAEIFLAKQHGAQGFEKSVVLKRIFTTFYADPQFRHMLVDEAHVAMTLNHSNIVQVLDLGEADGRYFLALELVDGWTLDRILRRSKAAGVPFPPALALYVTAEVCRALAYAHGKKRSDGESLAIVHRDMSPHNILVSEQGELKITDFGIAKAQTRREKSVGNLIKGKIAFMSPEQASGEPLDARSDLFSVGTMLYVMITRRHPFDAPTDYETLMLVKSGDFMPPETARPGLNPELYRVMRKSMAKSPLDRYQTANEMLVDVEQVMRLAFRPVGQTELQRWLADLSTKDGVPTLTREAPPEPAGRAFHRRSAARGRRFGVGTGAQPRRRRRRRRGQTLRPTAAATRRRDDPDAAPAGVPRPGQALVPAPRDPDRRRRPDRVHAGDLRQSSGAAAGRNRSRSHRRSPRLRRPHRPNPRRRPCRTGATAGAAARRGCRQDGPRRTSRPRSRPRSRKSKRRKSKPGEHEEKAAARTKRQTVAVTIKSDPQGSRVTTGRHVFGTTPLTLKLRPGNTYDLTFTKPGYNPINRKVHLEKDEPQTVRVTLKKLPEPPPKPAPPPKGPPPPPKKSSWFGR